MTNPRHKGFIFHVWWLLQASIKKRPDLCMAAFSCLSWGAIAFRLWVLYFSFEYKTNTLLKNGGAQILPAGVVSNKRQLHVTGFMWGFVHVIAHTETEITDQ